VQAKPGAVRSKEDQALLDLAEKDGLRRCPGCGQMVERTQVGCRGGKVGKVFRPVAQQQSCRKKGKQPEKE
jgi:hypothetical protein